ncbi:Cytosolic Fe-S cluster assembly factor NUBP2 homolog [Nesidiocoris tenuis]|uniref:Ubiquinone biosynthesis protein COQ4 homolog, mitochondrial n=1 Tax=Nesidiocoris tenuis TaxID=355587 RepID=A0ABN7BDE6_9HEMI|nr:Cytosolic Fe-S cluster assembly factor NUBP2 homolog [Nesidiocoris tenuis]
MSNILLRRISVNGANFVRFNSGALHPDFVSDFNQHHIQTSWLQKVILSVGSATVSMMDPSRGDMIATLGETTGRSALKYMKNRMEQSSEGADILRHQPRISSKTVDMDKLAKLPENTVGKVYYDWLVQNKVTPDSRLPVQFVDDVELAFVMQRYREVHDLVHAVLYMPTNMLGEVTVKWIEGLQTRLPMCLGGGIFGAVRLKPKQRQKYVTTYLPWAIKTGMTAEFMMNAYFEKRWEQPIAEFHDEFKIERLITENAAKISEEKKI